MKTIKLNNSKHSVVSHDLQNIFQALQRGLGGPTVSPAASGLAHQSHSAGTVPARAGLFPHCLCPAPPAERQLRWMRRAPAEGFGSSLS